MSYSDGNNSQIFVILSVVTVAIILSIFLLAIAISNDIADIQDEETGSSQTSGDESKSGSGATSSSPVASITDAADNEPGAVESDPSVVRFPANWTELSNEEKLALNPLNCPTHANGIIYISDITGECLEGNSSAAVPTASGLPADEAEFEFTETELQGILENSAMSEDEKLTYMYGYCDHTYTGNALHNDYCFYWVSPGERSDNPHYGEEICSAADYSLQIAVSAALRLDAEDEYREFCGSVAAHERWQALVREADDLGIEPWHNATLQPSLQDNHRAGLTFAQTDIILYFVRPEL